MRSFTMMRCDDMGGLVVDGGGVVNDRSLMVDRGGVVNYWGLVVGDLGVVHWSSMMHNRSLVVDGGGVMHDRGLVMDRGGVVDNRGLVVHGNLSVVNWGIVVHSLMVDLDVMGSLVVGHLLVGHGVRGLVMRRVTAVTVGLLERSVRLHGVLEHLGVVVHGGSDDMGSLVVHRGSGLVHNRGAVEVLEVTVGGLVVNGGGRVMSSRHSGVVGGGAMVTSISHVVGLLVVCGSTMGFVVRVHNVCDRGVSLSLVVGDMRVLSVANLWSLVGLHVLVVVGGDRLVSDDWHIHSVDGRSVVHGSLEHGHGMQILQVSDLVVDGSGLVGSSNMSGLVVHWSVDGLVMDRGGVVRSCNISGLVVDGGGNMVGCGEVGVVQNRRVKRVVRLNGGVNDRGLVVHRGCVVCNRSLVVHWGVDGLVMDRHGSMVHGDRRLVVGCSDDVLRLVDSGSVLLINGSVARLVSGNLVMGLNVGRSLVMHGGSDDVGGLVVDRSGDVMGSSNDGLVMSLSWVQLLSHEFLVKIFGHFNVLDLGVLSCVGLGDNSLVVGSRLLVVGGNRGSHVADLGLIADLGLVAGLRVLDHTSSGLLNVARFTVDGLAHIAGLLDDIARLSVHGLLNVTGLGVDGLSVVGLVSRVWRTNVVSIIGCVILLSGGLCCDDGSDNKRESSHLICTRKVKLL